MTSKPEHTPNTARPRITPGLLDMLSAPPPTSLTQAQAHAVDPDRYHPKERSAARAAGAVAHAMDYGLARNTADALSFVQATGWPGFQTLALLAQLPEYRAMHEAYADEAVRAWGQVTNTSKDAESSERARLLTAAMDRLRVREVVRQAVILDQSQGGAHVFPILSQGGSPVPLDSPLVLRPGTVTRGCLKQVTVVEPVWVTPLNYNASDPTAPDFYTPSSWYMLSREVHASRVFTLISRPVSDVLKPAYSFRGVSMSQLAMPYVDNWLRTRQSVSDTVKQFSVTYLKTDMAQMLQPGGAVSLMDRIQLFNLARDSRNLGICDKATEELAQVTTPLSGLDALQAQALEQLAAVSHIPQVKLLGVTPNGLNASSDGEIRVWYDHVAGYQAHNLTGLVLWLMQLIQLSEFGEIDPALGWEWSPLYELDDTELADVREKNARTDQVYFDMGVLAPEAIQARLTADPLSGYAGIQTTAMDDVREAAEAALASALAGPQAERVATNAAGNADPEPEPDADAA